MTITSPKYLAMQSLCETPEGAASVLAELLIKRRAGFLLCYGDRVLFDLARKKQLRLVISEPKQTKFEPYSCGDYMSNEDRK